MTKETMPDDVAEAIVKIQKAIDHASANFQEIKFREMCDLQALIQFATTAQERIDELEPEKHLHKEFREKFIEQVHENERLKSQLAAIEEEKLFWIEKFNTEVNLHNEVMRDNARLRGQLAAADEMEKALNFYSDINNYHNEESPFTWERGDYDLSPVLDRGRIARKALSAYAKAKE